MTAVPDVVWLSKLDTQFYSDPEYTEHVKYVSRSSTKQRSVRKEEKWKREKWLGRGGSSVVWLEQCFHGDSKGEVRAVKQVQKLEASNYYRELEAIALFSHTQYEQCFVKSFGWYDDDDHIFITMEYLPNGDLHKYLSSPLPEKEGQQICLQILEGLHHMHGKGFTHRDLKPANILIVCKGPDWWVKIADFGISKRATEGCTVLRTQIGTPAFAAPEVLGYFPLDNTSNDSYTNAVDIWSLGVIIFLILTGEPLFKDQRRLGQYVAGSFTFPLEALLANKISAQGCDFAKSLLALKSEDRPTVKECLHSPWLNYLVEAFETQRVINNSNSSPQLLNHLEPEPSASWSTQDQSPVHETHGSIGVLTERATSTSDNTTGQSSSQSANHTYHWTLIKERKVHSKSSFVWVVAFSPDGTKIVSGSSDGKIMLWDSATRATSYTIKGHSGIIYAIVFSPDGTKIVSGSSDGKIRLWDSATGAAFDTIECDMVAVLTVSFSPDGKQIASTSRDQNDIKLWDLATGAARGTLDGHSGRVFRIAFSPDGKQIASASEDKTIRLWYSATGAARGMLKGHSSAVRAVAFSPDGKQIASASVDKTIKIWDSATGAVCGTLEGHSDAVSAVAFSPDGTKIVSASGDGKIRLWDSATGAAHGTLKGFRKDVQAVSFSSDGKQITSVGTHGYILLTSLWGLTPTKPNAVSEYFKRLFK